MPSGIVVTCVATPALPRVLPHRGMADPARRDQRGQGRGDPGPPSRERGPAPTAPDAASGLGRPCRAHRTDQAPAPGVDGAPTRHPGHSASLAPAAGRPPMDISPPARTPAHRPGGRRPGRADGPGTTPAGATSASTANYADSATRPVRPPSAGSSHACAYHQRRCATTTPPGDGSVPPRHRPCWPAISSTWTARSPSSARTCSS
jgi:hypothetical protein